ncbi:MAG: metallophosphoesterase family protein [Herpetosiphonaceae bacterium]|nr:metallophosphoesterase family protein [Herpetosiphonaceae bacterium]
MAGAEYPASAIHKMQMQRICVISDTHGAYDERVERLFVGASHIIHAGDIGRATPPIIGRLELIAPVTVVTGNIDWNTALDIYPLTAQVTVGGVQIFVQHIGGKPAQFLRELPNPLPQVAICGHSHIALVEEYRGVLFVNPGSAGQPRFGAEPTVAFLDIADGTVKAEIVPLLMTQWL